MNALAILSLISDLYIQIENLQNKIDSLEENINDKEDRK